MGVKSVLVPLALVCKILFIGLVSMYSYRVLADENAFYELRGRNQVCQKSCDDAACRHNEVICSGTKFRRFVYLYIDSFPLDLFELENEFSRGNSKAYAVKHEGINDSGPIFSTVSTGKQSNKYEGSIAHLDNLFGQLKGAGFQVKGFGYHYPIAEMLQEDYFASYRNIGDGMHGAFCQDFFNLHDVTIEGMSVPDSLIQEPAKATLFLKKEYRKFKRQIAKRKRQIFKCLEEQFADGQSVFLYDVYTDSIGHEFSRQSKIYLKKMAALKANLDVFFEFVQKRLRDTVALVFSDHGVVRSPWESEISNHGEAADFNESFLFIFNSNFIRTEFDERPSIRSSDVSVVFAQVLANVNFPSNYLGMPPSVSKTLFHQMMTLRMKELQVLEYLATFPETTLAASDINLPGLIKDSLFHKFSYMVEHRHNLDGEKAKQHLKEYKRYVEGLTKVQGEFSKTKWEHEQLIGFIFNAFLVGLFLLEGYLSLVAKMQGLRFTFTWTFLAFLSMPVFFLVRAEIPEISFVYLQFLLLGSALTYALFQGSDFEFAGEFQAKISALLGFSILLLFFSEHVAGHSFFYMFYQNKWLQTAVTVLFLAASVVLFYRQKGSRTPGGISSWAELVFSLAYFGIDVVAIAYEVLLMAGSSFLQTIPMQRLSQIFYSLLVLLLLWALVSRQSKDVLLLSLAVKLVFWFGHNYVRLTCIAGLLPFAFFFKWVDRKFRVPGESTAAKTFRKALNFCLIIYTTYFIFHVTRGHLDTNISVRAGNRNWGLRIEHWPIFTGVIFIVNKYLVFILGFFVALFVSKQRSEMGSLEKSTWHRFLGSFDSVSVRLAECWYFVVILVYLETLESPEYHRAGMMLSASAIQLVGTCYAYSLTCCLRGLWKRGARYEKVPQDDSRVAPNRKRSRVEMVKMGSGNQLTG